MIALRANKAWRLGSNCAQQFVSKRCHAAQRNAEPPAEAQRQRVGSSNELGLSARTVDESCISLKVVECFVADRSHPGAPLRAKFCLGSCG